MNVPLGVLRSPWFDGRALHGDIHAGREGGVAAAESSGARPVRWRIGTQRAAPVELTDHREQLPQQTAKRPSAADRTRQGICGRAVILFLCELSQHIGVLLE